MNIKKYYRLNTREIRYILKTRKKFFIKWKLLNINFIDQYTDKYYNKFWIWISSKFSKKAVYRNNVRRIFFDIIYKKWYFNKKIDWNFKKIYVTLRKDILFNVNEDCFIGKIKENIIDDLNTLFNFIYKK